MDKRQLPDLIINGVSGGAGGTYNSVKIDGVGKVTGPIVTRIFKGNGHMNLKNDLSAEEAECNGTMKVLGHLRFNSLKVDGMITVGESFRGESCTLHGMLNIKGDCELEDFAGEGSFSVGGLLSAGHVDFKLQGQGKAHEIGVESLVIRQTNSGVWSKMLSGIIPKLRSELRARTIEGDFIDLEYTIADVIRGNIVIVGPGCTIERIEYRDQITVHPEAKVGKVEKIGE
ncbi:hypothetical protein [Paenibacillus odorifer]|uniref:hypothetical protein n=1 Tax=Paenibacillus TaxID=44249 RepID=UPI00096F0321|nr:hypothetical protein [Paenibacillus odorifer]OMD10184.1 hypothetical protein BJP47_05555 [Paenibacillus odorifer]